jgi:hypothetical protein
MKDSDINHINTLTNEVQNAFYALSQQLYASQSAQQTEPGQESRGHEGGNGHKPGNLDDEGEVLEGEFREM